MLNILIHVKILLTVYFIFTLQVLKKIQEITDAPEYLTNDNDQSVVEICITLVTSAFAKMNRLNFILDMVNLVFRCEPYCL